MAESHEMLRREFLMIYDDALQEFKNIAQGQGKIVGSGKWKVYLFQAYHRKIPAHRAACPETTRLIDRVPSIVGAMFSVLSPGAVLTPHRGPYFGVIRCLIPIEIPDGDCGMRIAGVEQRFKLGEPLIFDDTLIHESWNKTNQNRVVLFIDFLRPLPFPLNWFNRVVIRLIGYSPFIGEMVRKSR